jgi:glycosyltransferase involved in cell wall biosynthesis
MLRVLHVITGLSVGGAETMLLKLLGSRALGVFDHRVIALRSGGTLAGQFRTLGIDVLQLDMPRGVPGIRGTLDLARAVRRHDPDLIQGWMYHGNLAAFFARWQMRRRVPLIWNIRQSLYNLATERLTTRLAIKLGAVLSRRADCILYNSMTSMEQHHRFGFYAGRSMFVPNGFETERFAPDAAVRRSMRAQWGVADDDVLFGLVARFHPMKDHAGFLSAAARTFAARPSARFVLAGKGVDAENTALTGQISALGLGTRVILLGERRDVPAIMAALDVYVSSSSVAEAFSNSIGEAMSCGVVCVVTDVGDSAAIVAEGGTVVPRRDPAALAAAMIAQIDADPDGRRQIGQRARARVIEQYSLEAVAERYAALYREAIGAAIGSDRPQKPAVQSDET